MLQSISLSLHVQQLSSRQGTGVLGGQPGWQWDRRLLESDDIRTQYARYAQNKLGFKEGFKYRDIKAGTWTGMEYQGITHKYQDMNEYWVPRVKTGEYQVAYTKYWLYSDCSTMVVADADVVQLPAVWQEPLHIACWKRDNKLTAHIDRQWLENEDLVASVLDDMIYEYRIEDDEIHFNKAPVFKHTETLDKATSIFVCEYFPVLSASVFVDGEEYTQVSDWSEVDVADRAFVLNSEQGIIYLSGYEPVDTFLSKDLLVDDTAIELVQDITWLNTLPPQSGRVTIGGELIEYKYRDGYSLYGLTRSAPVNHDAGDLVVFSQQGHLNTGEMIVNYSYAPAIVFETCNSTERHCNYQSWLDIQPVRRINQNGILQLTNRVINISELVLSTTVDQMSASLFGPVFFGSTGNDWSVLALDAGGNVVEGINIQVEILDDGVGFLSGFEKTASGVTGLNGRFNGFFFAPWRGGDSELLYDNVTVSGGQSIFQLDELISFDINRVWLYQILKDDFSQGTVGYKYEVDSTSGNFISLSKPVSEIFFQDGIVYSGAWEARVISVTGANTILVDQDPSGITDFRLLPAGSIKWDRAELNGVRRLVFEVTDMARPVKPVSIAGQIVYDFELPVPDPFDDDNPVGGYSVVTGRVVTLQASCVDPASGRVIQSNQIRYAVELPSFLIGDHFFNNQESYGFRVGTGPASGIGGANYFTLNPISQQRAPLFTEV